MDYYIELTTNDNLFSQTVEYATESITKPELKEDPQILENIPGRSVTEYFLKYLVKKILNLSIFRLE